MKIKSRHSKNKWPLVGMTLACAILLSCRSHDPAPQSAPGPGPNQEPQPTVTSPPSSSFSIIRQQSLNGLLSFFTTTPDGGQVFIGSSSTYSSADLSVVKFGNSGNKVWSKQYGGSGGETPVGIINMRDGGFAIIASIWEPDGKSPNGDITGYHPTSISEGTNDIWVLKLDANGNLLKQRALGGTLNEQPGFIIESNDGGLIIAGASNSSNGDLTGVSSYGNFDGWIVKLDQNLSISWQKKMGGSAADTFNSVYRAADGGILIAASTLSNDGIARAAHVSPGSTHGDFWILKLNETGSIVWTKTYGGSHDDTPKSILELSDGNIVVGGVTQSSDGDVTGFHNYVDHGVSNVTSDAWVMKLTKDGNMVWQKCFGGTGSETFFSAAATSDNSIMFAGLTDSNNSGDVIGYHGGAADAWILQLNASGQMVRQKCWGGSRYDSGSTLGVTNDGNVTVCVQTDSSDGDSVGLGGNAQTYLYCMLRMR